MTPAWLLDFGGGRRAAVGDLEQVQLLHEPECHDVPGTPRHARHVLLWSGRCVPVLDLAAWLDGASASRERSARYLGIYAYDPPQHAESSIGAEPAPALDAAFGALWLAQPPKRVLVHDDDAAPLPDDGRPWSRISLSCFTHDSVRVPIIDLRTIFSGALNA